MPTLLALGAHYDDCVFGIPGILLKAVRKNYRVVIAALIGDYSNWPPIGDRHKELLPGTQSICRGYGVEMRYLNFRTHLFDVDSAGKKQVASLVADVQPDLAFVLWRQDHHDDHVVASQLSTIALRYAAPLLDKRPVRTPRRIYAYDNGPRHTIGFEPDTFVDVTDEWPKAIEWLGRFMALVRGEDYKPGALDPAQRAKESLALYRGSTCGVRYAEGVRSLQAHPVEIL